MLIIQGFVPNMFDRRDNRLVLIQLTKINNIKADLVEYKKSHKRETNNERIRL